MFPEERRLSLLQFVRKRGAVKISELSEDLGVSKVTIRRDSEKLEKEGYIKRAHGGVFSLDRIKRELSFDEKIIVNLPQKRKIGRKAVSLIQENDTIFLGTGTTTMQIVQNINREKNLVVSTNCLLTAYELSNLPKVHLIMTGGELRRPSYALVGSKAMKCTEDMVIDKFFLGVEGISMEYGITIASEFEAEICRKVMNSSKTTVVVADSSKFGKIAFARIASIDAVNMIITDAGVAEKYQQLLQKRVEIVVC